MTPILIITTLCGALSNSDGLTTEAQPDVAIFDDSNIARALEDMRYDIRGHGFAILTDAEWVLVTSRWVSMETCAALKDTIVPRDEIYVLRLQFILGILKDPNTAAFLRCYWSRHSNYGLTSWISGWRIHRLYYVLHKDEWNAMKEHWSAHFQWLLRQRMDSDTRVIVLITIDNWFFDEAMIKALLAYRDREDLSAREQVVVEGILWRRDQLNQERFETAFDRLSRIDPESFMFYAYEYPAVACVRPLIRLVTESPERGAAAERLLERVTFRERPSNGWLQWFECNRNAPRTAWLAEATGPIKIAIAEKNWPLVRSFISKHGLRNDIVFVDWVTQLAKHDPLVEDIASFLQPSLNPRFEAVITPALAELRRQAEKDQHIKDVLRSRLLVPLSWEASLEELIMHGMP